MGLVEILFGGSVAVGLKRLFTWNYQSFPPCNMIVLKEGRGWPWSKQLVCHTTHEGDITIRPADSDQNILPNQFPPELPQLDEDPPRIGF